MPPEANPAIPLIGQRLERVEPRDYSWFFYFSGRVYVGTESMWRLVGSEGIATTSEDHGHPFGLPSPVDSGERVRAAIGDIVVTEAQVIASTGDLLVTFADGARSSSFRCRRDTRRGGWERLPAM